MTTALIILTLLFIKHFVADFVVQFNYMIAEKGIYGAEGGLEHSTIHMLGTAIILGFFLADLYTVWLLALADFVIHYHIDWLKMNIGRWRGLTIQDHEFWVWFGADQLAHCLTYIGIVWYIL